MPPGLENPHTGPHRGKQRGTGREGPSDSPLFRYIQEGDCVYFVHSFCGADCQESVIASAEYGAGLTAAVAHENVYGVQFHPEKSGDVGLNILRAFCAL